MLEHCDVHGVTARLESRLVAAAGPEDDALLRGLRQRMERLRSVARRHLATIESLRERLPDVPLVMVKGMSTSLITGRPQTLRTGDIDLVILPEHAPRVTAGLEALGHVRTRPPFMHEIGEFTAYPRGAEPVEVDLHAFYPVNRLQLAVPPSADLAGGVRADLAVTVLDATALARHREAAPSSDVAGALPDPEAAVLVLASHAYGNWTNLWSISHRRKAYVRLGELADLADLAEHPSFRRDRFEALVAASDGTTCVTWAAAACRRVLGRDPFPQLADSGTDADAMLRCLWWDVWARVPGATPSWLAVDWLRMGALVRDLGALSRRGSSPDVRPASPPGGVTVLTGGRTVPADWHVQVTRRAGRLDVRVTFGAQDGGVRRVRVDLGHTATEWSGAAVGRAGTWVGDPPLDVVEEGRGVRMSHAAPDAATYLPVLVGMSTQTAAGQGTAVLPLLVEPEVPC